MAGKSIWYVAFPTYQYAEDVEALAREWGLRILNARYDAGDGADEVPELTMKSGEPMEQSEPEPEPETETETEPDADVDASVTVTFDVYKLTDGVRGDRASKYNLTAEEAQLYVAERPENQYEIVQDET